MTRLLRLAPMDVWNSSTYWRTSCS